MKSVIMSVLLAGILVFYLAGQDTQQTPKQDSKSEGKQDTKKGSAPASISPLIPVPAAGDAAAAADPAKIASPAGTPSGITKTVAGVDTKNYIIGSDDELSIIVFENSQFNVPLETVRPDGKVTMPLIGELQASGKTPDQLKGEITETLSREYMNLPPHVSVIVVRVLSKNYYINGEVLKPGKYPLTVPTTVMQALVNAGGFKDFANKKKIKIQRGAKFFTFNYKEVSQGKKLEQNILLEPDDQIFVN